jgi:nicotinate-nucleotide adenylyltransferase
MTGAPRVGIFGGTFNPIHLGHLRAAEEVTEALALERMIFVPSAQPPHKRGSADDPIAPPAERLSWTRAATAANPRFEVDPLEIERTGPSYSVETLRALVPRGGGEPPVFTIGHDAFVELGTWREPEVLLTLAHFAVIARPPVAEGTLADWMPKCLRPAVELARDGRSARHRGAGTWIRLLDIRGLDVSASDIRARLREGRSVRYLVPEAVLESVQHSGAYARR